MPRYAAIDIGSNSVRLLVGDYAPGSALRVLAAEREVTRLGAGVFRSGRIDDQAIDFLCTQLSRMAQVIGKQEVAAIRAVATAAVRDANNQQEFIARASQALGAPIEVISGQEEARLIHLGVTTRWPQPKGRVLLVDLGGGSVEVTLSEDGQLQEAFSKPLGAVRLNEVFLQKAGDPPPAEELHRMERYIDEKLDPAVERFGRGKFTRLIATSASAAAIVCAINRIPRARREEADRLRATTAQVRRFYQEAMTKSLAQRRHMVGLGPRRAEIIIPGAALYWRVLENFQHHSLYYLAAGVREGIITDLASRGVGELSRLSREQRIVVERLSRRYAVPVKHSRKVAALAHQIFGSMNRHHRLPPACGKILEAAAYLHDTGHFISDTSHHKHSEYLVRNADLAGFTDHERILVAMLCRYHRKAMPQPRHSEYQALSPEERRIILFLIPLLRLADSLDRTNHQLVESVKIEESGGALLASIRAHGDSDLDEWAAERLTDVFQLVYGKPLEVMRVRAA